MIRATAHSDDYAIEISFDAESYFEKASDKDLKDLIDCDFGGDYPADYVALSFENDPTREVFRMMSYVRLARIGFECYVNSNDALAWLAANRPALLSEEGI